MGSRKICSNFRGNELHSKLLGFVELFAMQREKISTQAIIDFSSLCTIDPHSANRGPR
jgi:hypothetical protein